MTNAEMLAKDLDRLAQLMVIGDAEDELGICTLQEDEVTSTYNGCRYEENLKCVDCVKKWLEQEANENGGTI